jgi:predicted transcriptional regulator
MMRDGRNKKRKLKSFHKTAVILLKCIDSKPGIRYRQLLRKTNLANGILSYHLGILEKSKSIKIDRSSTVELALSNICQQKRLESH